MSNDELARTLGQLVREARAIQGCFRRLLELPAFREEASAPLLECALTELERLANRAEAFATLANPTQGESAPTRLHHA